MISYRFESLPIDGDANLSSARGRRWRVLLQDGEGEKGGSGEEQRRTGCPSGRMFYELKTENVVLEATEKISPREKNKGRAMEVVCLCSLTGE